MGLKSYMILDTRELNSLFASLDRLTEMARRIRCSTVGVTLVDAHQHPGEVRYKTFSS
jgi:hypothetical protein